MPRIYFPLGNGNGMLQNNVNLVEIENQCENVSKLSGYHVVVGMCETLRSPKLPFRIDT